MIAPIMAGVKPLGIGLFRSDTMDCVTLELPI